MKSPKRHHINPALLQKKVSVAVVGCGGTGSAIAAGLPLLHQAMLAWGHPGGLSLLLYDPDIITETNCVRQPFSRSEIGQLKAKVLATRIQAFWGMDCVGINDFFNEDSSGADIIIGCVDTRQSRLGIAQCAEAKKVAYWLDCGNGSHTGQFILGEPNSTDRKIARGESHLRTVADRYPETIDSALDSPDDGPTCSAVEALTKQAPFTNQTIANHALALLALLFREGAVDYCGGFIDLSTGHCSPIPVGI